ncbi:outer membrane protein [Oceanidesulfovibrio indonesiensis]|nr:outer membrane beta-barrel protein [Oceanidesulfovibrio indonesiensis]
MKRGIISILAAVMMIVSAQLASAQTFETEKFYIAPEFGAYGTSQKDVDLLLSYGGSIGYFVLDNLSLGLEANGYYADIDRRDFFDSRSSSANGFGFNALIRLYLVNEDPFRLYVGTGIGGLFMDEALVYDGDSDYLTVPVDLGMTVNFTKNFALDIGGRYQRIGFTDKGVDAWGGRAALRIMF